MPDDTIIKRPFGNSEIEVTMVGLGGEGVLRTFGRDQEAVAVIEEALSNGIAYFDSARAYAGSEAYYGRVWPKRTEARGRIFQTSKSAERTKEGALADLDHSLATMGVDHLDLWQIHDVRTMEDIENIGGPGGALEAFLAARAAGKVRFIGVTGHHDPSVLTRAVQEWPMDAVLLPVNPVEAVLGGFLDTTLPAAVEKGLAVIGMMVLGASYYISPQAGVSAERLIKFALSQPITLVVVGCGTPVEVNTLAGVGREFQPMPEAEQQALIRLFEPQAARLAFYRGNI